MSQYTAKSTHTGNVIISSCYSIQPNQYILGMSSYHHVTVYNQINTYWECHHIIMSQYTTKSKHIGNVIISSCHSTQPNQNILGMSSYHHVTVNSQINTYWECHHIIIMSQYTAKSTHTGNVIISSCHSIQPNQHILGMSSYHVTVYSQINTYWECHHIIMSQYTAKSTHTGNVIISSCYSIQPNQHILGMSYYHHVTIYSQINTYWECHTIIISSCHSIQPNQHILGTSSYHHVTVYSQINTYWESHHIIMLQYTA